MVFLLCWLMAPVLAGAAERILALTPHVCEMMYAIGAGKDVVGTGEFCDFPAAATQSERVANYRQVYVERALALKPTLVIALSPALKGLDTLRQTGVRIVISNPQSIAGVFADIRRLGRISGHVVRADRLADQLERRLNMLMRQQQNPPLRVFYELWNQPLMAVGGMGFLQDTMTHAGLLNVFGNMPLESVRVSVESVLRAHPALIIVAGKGVDLAARRTYWHRWLPKVKVLAVNADLLHRPGPRIVDGLEQLVRRIHGLQIVAGE